jgi:oxygen-dependent protoporphyrinogen oxidase
MAQLVAALAQTLAGEDLRTGVAVTGIERLASAAPSRYRVTAQDGTTLEADAIILTAPAYTTGRLVAPLVPELGQMLCGIRYVSTATVSLAFRGQDLQCVPEGNGFVIPVKEGRQILACTLSSKKFNYRAPHGDLLLRCFVGGPGHEELVELSDEALAAIARKEMAALLGIQAEPLFARVYRWRQANPQYDVGHLECVRRMYALCQALPGVYLTGAAYEGVGVPDCIRQAEQAAQKALAHLAAVLGQGRLP